MKIIKKTIEMINLLNNNKIKLKIKGIIQIKKIKIKLIKIIQLKKKKKQVLIKKKQQEN